MDAIFAYLRTLPAVRERRPSNEFPWPLSEPVVMNGWNALYFSPGTYKPDRNKSAQWNRGACLVQGLGHCGACHSPRNTLGAVEKSHVRGETDNWFAPALDNGKPGGLGDWSAKDIVRFLKTGHSSESLAYGPMGQVVRESTSKMSEDDLKAIAVYLKSLPAGKEKETAGKPSANVRKAGAAIYLDTCSACHGLKGDGTGQHRRTRLPVGRPRPQAGRQIGIGGQLRRPGRSPRHFRNPPSFVHLSCLLVARFYGLRLGGILLPQEDAENDINSDGPELGLPALEDREPEAGRGGVGAE